MGYTKNVTFNVLIPKSDTDEVDKLVSIGKYASRSDATRHALRKLIDQDCHNELEASA